jgi:hypothetical protein
MRVTGFVIDSAAGASEQVVCCLFASVLDTERFTPTAGLRLRDDKATLMKRSIHSPVISRLSFLVSFAKTRL